MITWTGKSVFASLLLLSYCLLSASAFAAAAGYYKWIDDRGNPHHSDRPPPAGVEYEYISTDTGMKRRVTAQAPQTSSAAAMPPPQPEPTTVAQQQVKIRKNPAYCDQARANLDTLDSKARVRIRSADGEISYLTEEEKDIQRRKATDMIAIHCN